VISGIKSNTDDSTEDATSTMLSLPERPSITFAADESFSRKARDKLQNLTCLTK
jgi:hypothetical protein